jgi:hypothetical protein
VTRPLADLDALPPSPVGWRKFEDCSSEEQARALAKWGPTRAGLPGTPAPVPSCVHDAAVWVAEADGTEWCPLCSGDLEAFAGVVLRWIRAHQDERLLTTWDIAWALSPASDPAGPGGITRRALGELLRWLERDGHVRRDGYAPARWVDGTEDSVCVWRAT